MIRKFGGTSGIDIQPSGLDLGLGENNIKSIQTIESSIASVNSMVITINPVNVNNSVVLVEIGNAHGTSLNSMLNIVATLTNSTTVTISSGATQSSTPLYFKVTVIEFNNVKSKQTGTITPSSYTNQNVTISSVDPSKVMCIARMKMTTGVSELFVEEMYGVVTAATNLKLTYSTSINPSGITVYWQVIEFN